MPCPAPQPTPRSLRPGRSIGSGSFARARRPRWVERFRKVRERGYVDGKNVVVEFGFTDGGVDQLPRRAEELVRLKVDVIVASAAPAALAAKKATTSVPIVFVGVIDPVELGLVPSLARPGVTSRDWPTAVRISPGSAWSC